MEGDGQVVDGPLAGVRVIDLTRALAGPFCTLVLAGLGADVIKLEEPAVGDVARGNAPYVGPAGLGMSPSGPDDLSLATLNRCRGKRSVTLDLKRTGAQRIFEDLVCHADVVVENFSSGTAERLGVGYAVARSANPSIVYCSISGFGAGSDSGVRAMDAIIQALSGIMLTSGDAEDPPIRVGVPVADVLTPVWAVVGILAALQRRQRSGTGEHVDVSMLGVLTSLVASEDWAALGQLGQPMRTGPTLPRLAPFGLYRCADGWIALVAPQDKLVAALFGAMGRPELQKDPRFATRDVRVSHHSELSIEIESWTAELSVAAVVDALDAAGVPAAPVRSPVEAVIDRRVVARRETVQVEHPRVGPVDGLWTSGVPVRMSGDGVGFTRLAPYLGEHTEEVLSGLCGYSLEELRALRRQRVI